MKKTPDFAAFAVHPKTLFAEWPGRLAVLVTTEAGQTKAAPMEFPDARAALAWCEANRAALVYLPPDDPQGN